MPRTRRKLGPLFYVTLAASCLLLLVVYGKLTVWPSVEAAGRCGLSSENGATRASRKPRGWQPRSGSRNLARRRFPLPWRSGTTLSIPCGARHSPSCENHAPTRDAIATCLKALKTSTRDPQVRVSAVELLGPVAIPGQPRRKNKGNR